MHAQVTALRHEGARLQCALKRQRLIVGFQTWSQPDSPGFELFSESPWLQAGHTRPVREFPLPWLPLPFSSASLQRRIGTNICVTWPTVRKVVLLRRFFQTFVRFCASVRRGDGSLYVLPSLRLCAALLRARRNNGIPPITRHFYPLALKLALRGSEAIGKSGLLVRLYKNKGEHDECRNHRGILLAPVLAKAIHQCVRPSLCPS